MKIRLCQLSKLISCSVLAIVIAAVLPAKAAAQSASQADVDRRVDAMLAKLTLEQKIDLIGGEEWMFIRAVPEIGLPRLKMSDGPMGVRSWGTTSGYAAGIGLAASWDTELAHRVGAAIGQDARARGVNFLLGPGVNIYRAPMNGRNFEYYGEDPYLAGRIAVHYIQGVQSQGVVATVKHYAGNNSEYDRHNVNSVIDERTLREIYLPAFEASIKEGHAASVMCAYPAINDAYSCENEFLLKQVLRQEWGFQGFVTPDYLAVHNMLPAVLAGLDVDALRGEEGHFAIKELKPAIESGKAPMPVVDEMLIRRFRTMMEMGVYDHPATLQPIPEKKDGLDALRIEPNARNLSQLTGEEARVDMILPQPVGHLFERD